MEASPAKGVFQLTGMSGKAAVRVLGEDRTIPASEGRFEDDFPPYAVHLYRVAEASASASSPAADEVTIKGMVLNNVHTGEDQTSVFVYALDGTPEIRAVVDRIMAQDYPDKGLDGDAARKLQDQFTAKLKYFIDGPHADELCKKATYGARQPTALTGRIAEKDGKRWITVSKYADTTLHYPAKMLAADQPLVMPDKAPLLLKINDRLSLKCIWVPPGKFLMGEPYYQCPHWQEAPPHMVTLTKGFYLAEHPVTQEMFEAVVGSHPGTEKAAKAPVNASCAGMYEFCRILSQKSGRKIRVPTAAEWEYAARVGTSNPAFREKYKDQDSSGVRPIGGQIQAAQRLGLLRHGEQRVGADERRLRPTRPPGHGRSAAHSARRPRQGRPEPEARALRQGQWAICRQRNRVHQQRPRPGEDLSRHHAVSRGGGRAVSRLQRKGRTVSRVKPQ